MNVKEAVRVAKAYVTDIFEEEAIAGVRLEEIVFDDIKPSWRITISFTRPEPRSGFGAVLSAANSEFKRAAKVVEIDDDSGSVISITNRS